jgi:hypothetical protein
MAPRPILVLCDHAANHVPASVNGGDLGLPEAEMGRHIAYDIGARGVSVALAEMLDAPAVLTRFSRLVIDPNRGRGRPDAGDAALRRHDRAGKPAGGRARDRAAAEPLSPAVSRGGYRADRRDGRRRTAAGAGGGAFLHAAAAGARAAAVAGGGALAPRRAAGAAAARPAASRAWAVRRRERALFGAARGRYAEPAWHAARTAPCADRVAPRRDPRPRGQQAWAERLAPMLAGAVAEIEEEKD